MNFAFSDEQEELRAAVRRFLAEKSPETEVRRLMDTTEGYDPAVWSQMADQLGLQSLTIPEEFGGSGFTYVELLVVLEEMGAALLCAPFFSSVALAANALLTSGDDEAKKSYLPGIASGETIATLAITEDNGKWDFSGIECAATKKGDGWVLNGHKMFVIDGHVANLIIVAARTAAGVSLFAVPGDAVGPDPHAAADDGPDAQAGPARVRGRAGHAHRRRRRRGARPVQDARPGRGGAGRRAGRRRPARARRVGRVRQDAHPVRPAHRQLPGHQAQVRRHAARGRVGQVGRLLRGAGPRPRTPTSCPSWPAWPSRTARRPTSTRRRRTSRSTVASASPGSTRPTCTSSGPSRPSCSWAIPRTTASCWHSASASDMAGPFRLQRGPAGDLATYASTTSAGAPVHGHVVLCHDLPRPKGAAADVAADLPGPGRPPHPRVGLARRHGRAARRRRVGRRLLRAGLAGRPGLPGLVRDPRVGARASWSASASAACWRCTWPPATTGWPGWPASARRPTSARWPPTPSSCWPAVARPV